MSRPLTAILLTALVFCGRSAALEPSEILVLVNQQVPHSVALGRFYCEKRGVPEGNLVALSLPEGDSMDPSAFDSDLRAPLRQAMIQRGLTKQVKCILTTWGVPYQLTAAPRPPEVELLLNWWRQAVEKSETALAADLERLKVVGEHFPATASSSTDIERLEGLFDMTPEAPAELQPGESVVQVFLDEAGRTLNRVRSLDDEQKIDIGKRQVLALYFHAFGLQGLQRGLETVNLADGPDPQGIQKRIESIRARLDQIVQTPVSPENLAEMEKNLLTLQGHQGLLAFARSKLTTEQVTSSAALDSELSLLFWDDYVREGQTPNLLHWRGDSERQILETRYGRQLMVARLDGPSPAWAVRMVKDALAAERVGLDGVFYIDLGDGTDQRRQAYDSHLRGLGRMLQRDTEISVKLERTAGAFPPGSCPNAALYVGWYSPGEYVPAFTWTSGAVGYHLSSSEAQHLRDPNSSEWVPNMLARGVAVTIGAAEEPFLAAFPLPEEFFPLVLSGNMTVCEAYWRTVPHASWRLMFLGDPLYNPFRARPQDMRLPGGLLEESETGGVAMP